MPMTEGTDSIITKALDSGVTWHQVGATGEPAFGTGWSNIGGTYATLAFGSDPNGAGLIRLRGCVKQIGSTVTIFTLPVGYRPAQTEVFTSGLGSFYNTINIQSSGLVYIASLAGSLTGNVQTSLSGISFEPA